MGTQRRSRQDRPPKRPVRLTDEDPKLLRAIGRMRLPTTSQLRRLFYTGRTAVTRRLAKLASLGLVRAFCLDLNSENLYALTPKGLSFLVAEGVAADELHVQKSILRSDAHLVAVNDLRVALVVAVRRRPEVEIEFFFADHDLKRQALQEKRKIPRYIPDALTRIVAPEREPISLVVEVDLATEHRRQFAPKVTVTVEHHQKGRSLWGLLPFRPLLLARGDDRLRYLAEVIVAGGGGDLWLVADLDRFLADPFGLVVTSAKVVAETPREVALAWSSSLVPGKRA